MFGQRGFIRGNNKNMKQPLIIGNWKMQLDPSESLKLAKKLARASAKYKEVEVIVCPSFTEIAAVGEIIKGKKIKLGAQDCFWESEGEFTGEVSPKFLKEYGVEYIIIGHSERRQYVHTTNEMINEKIKALLEIGITPIMCVGETFEQRQDGEKEAILIKEITDGLKEVWLNKSSNLIIAYEPIWMIGSGQEIDPSEVEHTHQVIKQTLYDIFPDTMVDEQVKIIYGGSVNPENITAFLEQSAVDGALIGGSSLDATKFSTIIAASINI